MKPESSTRRVLQGLALAVACVTFAAASASAQVDLTGRWANKKTKCRGIDETGSKTNLKLTLPELVIDDPVGTPLEEANVTAQMGNDNFDGRLYGSTKKAKAQGEGMFQQCPGTELVTLHVKKVKTFPPNKKNVSGSMTADLIRTVPAATGQFAGFTVCSTKWERVSMTPPKKTPPGCQLIIE